MMMCVFRLLCHLYSDILFYTFRRNYPQLMMLVTQTEANWNLRVEAGIDGIW